MSSSTDQKADAPDVAQTAPRGRRTQLILVVALVAALVAAAYAGWSWKRLDDREASGDEALKAARALAVDVTSYDYRKVDDFFTTVEKSSTGEFAENYRGNNEDLRDLIVETKSVVTSKVLAAGIQKLSDDRAEVVVILDQAVQNTGLPEPRSDRNRVLMVVERDGDEWLVSGIELL